MCKFTERNNLQRLFSFALVCAMLFFFMGFIVQPANAADGTDVAVIGLSADGENVKTTLYIVQGTAPGSIDISYYRNGSRIANASASPQWIGNKASVEKKITGLESTDNLTVIIGVDGDTNFSNNNRTISLGSSSTGTVTPPVDPDPVKPAGQLTVQSVSVSPSTLNPGDTCTITATVTNSVTGSDPVSGAIAFYFGNTQITSVQVSNVAVGDTKSVTCSYTLPNDTEQGKEYAVRAVYGASSQSAAITVPAQQPTQVKQATISHSGETTSGVTLTWGYDNSSAGEVPTNYAITIGSQTHSATAPGSYTFTGLTAGQTYTYQVVAFQGSLTSEASGSVTLPTITLVDGIDLIVSEITWEPANPRAGDSVVFSAVVTNQGKQPIETMNAGLRFSIGGRDNSPYTWNDQYKNNGIRLGPGESIVMTATGGNNGKAWTPSNSGDYIVYAWVDDNNEKVTGEANEDNNVLTKTVTVKEAAGLDIPDTTPGTAHVHTSGVPSGFDKTPGIEVTVNGQSSGVFNAPVNNGRFYNNPIQTTTPATICEKSDNGTAIVRIARTQTTNSVVVRPLSANITPISKTMDGVNYWEFTITDAGSYSVEFNGSTDNALQLFVNPDYTCKHTGGYDGNYLALGQVSEMGSISGHWYGSGIIKRYNGNTHASLYIYDNNTTIEGLTLLNGWGNVTWGVEVNRKTNVKFDYFHIIANGTNSDGISIQSSDNITISNCYFRTWDDGVVCKIYEGRNTHDVTVTNTVFWTDLAQSMEIGAETNKYNQTGDPQIYNIKFEDISVIHANHKPAISIHNMDNAKVHHITWRNITIEDASMGYNAGTNGDGWPILIDITNVKGGEVPGTASSWTSVSTRGSVYDVTIENVNVLSWKNDVNKKPGLRIINSEDGGTIERVNIINLQFGGEKVQSMEALENDASIYHYTFTGHDGQYGSCNKDHKNCYKNTGYTITVQ